MDFVTGKLLWLVILDSGFKQSQVLSSKINLSSSKKNSVAARLQQFAFQNGLLKKAFNEILPKKNSYSRSYFVGEMRLAFEKRSAL